MTDIRGKSLEPGSCVYQIWQRTEAGLWNSGEKMVLSVNGAEKAGY